MDVTPFVEQERMSEASESQYRLQAVLDTAVDGIVTIDERGIIRSANPAMGKLFGFASATELVGRNVSILMISGYILMDNLAGVRRPT